MMAIAAMYGGRHLMLGGWVEGIHIFADTSREEVQYPSF